MKARYLIALSAILVTAALGCGVLDTVVNQAVSGGKPAGTVADLWTDVPKMNGMNKVDLQLPIAAQVAMKAITQGNFSASEMPRATILGGSKTPRKWAFERSLAAR